MEFSRTATDIETIFTGRNLIRLDEINSTNHYLSTLLPHGSVPEGTTVVAGAQTAGKGQGGKSWHSAKGENLLLTVYWRPAFLESSRIIELSHAVATAVVNMLAEFDIESRIKLPNDIYINDKKIAGILIENTLRGNELHTSLIGIGLNVNQSAFPNDLPNPISMKQVTGLQYSLNDCLHVLCNCLEKQYFKLKNAVHG